MNDAVRAAVERLVPHRGGMLWLERILACDGDGAVAEAVVREEHPFFDGAGVPAWVGIEYMAQAISALGGLRAKEKNEAIRIGFLLGTRKMLLQQKVLRVGHSYQVHVKQLFWDDSGLANFDCEIREDQEMCATAKITVFETDDVKKAIEVQ